MSDYNYLHPGIQKVVHHLSHLDKMQKGRPVGPIHLSVFPNNFCQLNCEYCCFKKTARNSDELSLHDFRMAVNVLTKYGLKALEFSGGGDPLLWTSFNDAVNYAYDKGLKLSLVTNGLALKTIPKSVLEKFEWIRISIQSVKHAEKILSDYEFPYAVRHSMSFIVHDYKSFDELRDLHEFAKKNAILIRVAPIRPCSEIFETVVGKEVKDLGEPLLFFKKEFGSPLGCYMPWIRAAIDWKGNFLTCPSIELTFESPGYIPDDFTICKIEDLEEWILETPVHDMGYRCTFCNPGKDTNDFIHNIMKPVEDVDFV